MDRVITNGQGRYTVATVANCNGHNSWPGTLQLDRATTVSSDDQGHYSWPGPLQLAMATTVSQVHYSWQGPLQLSRATTVGQGHYSWPGPSQLDRATTLIQLAFWMGASLVAANGRAGTLDTGSGHNHTLY